MQKNDCLLVGKLTKEYGTDGELILSCNSQIIEELDNKKEPVFIEFDEQLVPFFIEKIQRKSANSYLLKFDDLPSRARMLIGCEVFMFNDEAQIEEGELDELSLLYGFSVVDKEKGEIGILDSIIEYPGNPVFSILYKKKEILIPANQDFILEIDEEKRILYIETPEGLIDLYLE